MGRIADFFAARQNVEPTHERQFSTFSFSDYLGKLEWSYNGNNYLSHASTWDTSTVEEIGPEFSTLVQSAYKRNGVVFACILARALVFSDIRFKYRTLSDKRMFGDGSLMPLERPSPNQTTGELLFRAEQDVSLAGNWFGYKRPNGTVKRLRPDWMDIILGSDLDSDHPGWQLDATVLGYTYWPGGRRTNNPRPMLLTREQVAHWSPIPDPDAEWRGMSWLQPVVREVVGDNAATDHKNQFFANAATPNIIIIAPETVTTQEQFESFRAAIDADSKGTWNAYKNLYLAAGADVKVVGADLKQLDFKATQGAGETRIAVASRVPATVLGISEGMQGSSLNAGNFSSSRRLFADGFLRPQWRSACAAFASLVQVPSGSELWFDESDVGFLREDEKDAAEITNIKASAARQLIDGGYEPDTVTQAVATGDITVLTHTGKTSVQLHDPNEQPAPGTGTEQEQANDDDEP